MNLDHVKIMLEDGVDFPKMLDFVIFSDNEATIALVSGSPAPFTTTWK